MPEHEPEPAAYRVWLQQLAQQGMLSEEPEQQKFLSWCQQSGLDLYQQDQRWHTQQQLRLIDLERVKNQVQAQLEEWHYFLTIGSTNQYLLHTSASTAVCVAESQTAGQGRQGRVWRSNLAQNLLFSLKLPQARLGPVLDQASIRVGLAVAELLQHYQVPLQLKWPNDLWLNGEKLGGILLQLSSRATPTLVIGIGLNVQQAPATDPGRVAPTSLWQAGYPLERETLLVALIDSVYRELMPNAEIPTQQDLRQRYARFDALRGRRTTWLSGHQMIEGVAQGIASDGALLLQTDSELLKLHSGEVHCQEIEVAVD